MMNKVTFIGFRGGDRLNCPRLDPPPHKYHPFHAGFKFEICTSMVSLGNFFRLSAVIETKQINKQKKNKNRGQSHPL